jgi:Protein of unknown function (DUF3300)
MQFASSLCCLLSATIAIAPLASAQTAPATAPAPAAQSAAGAPTFKQEELDALLAPIALYPDALLAQIMMASTYPLEIVEAARWQKANASLKGTALEDAARQQSWDESVKSLVMFPDVLSRMNQDLAWTQKLGDAFLGQQAQVLATVQSLRQRAQAAGNLKSNEQQKVETQTQEGKQVIVVEPASPQIVYVPSYQPTYVYGAWPYPAYPPYYPSYWYPPGAAFVGGFFWGVGIAAGAALWGGYNWGRGDVNINVNRYNEFNRTNINSGNWNHKAEHRGSVPYRDQGSRDKYGKYDRQAAQSREQFRGRDDSLGGKGLDDRSGLNEARDRGVGSPGDRSGSVGGAGTRDLGGAQAGTRDLGGASGRTGSAQAGTRDAAGASNRAASSDRGGAFSGGSGAQTRAASDRGRSSMSSAPARSAPSGGARTGGGGGARGGGGRR